MSPEGVSPTCATPGCEWNSTVIRVGVLHPARCPACNRDVFGDLHTDRRNRR